MTLTMELTRTRVDAHLPELYPFTRLAIIQHINSLVAAYLRILIKTWTLIIPFSPSEFASELEFAVICSFRRNPLPTRLSQLLELTGKGSANKPIRV